MKTLEQLKEQGIISNDTSKENNAKEAIAEKTSELKLLPVTPSMQSTPSNPAVNIQNPGVQTQDPSGTSMVPAVSVGGADNAIVASKAQRGQIRNASEAKEAQTSQDVPSWLRRGDGGSDTTQPVEFMLRGVSSKENLSPITVVLLSYLRYLGGDKMASMSLGDRIDYVVRRFCREHGVDLQIGRKILGEDVQI